MTFVGIHPEIIHFREFSCQYTWERLAPRWEVLTDIASRVTKSVFLTGVNDQGAIVDDTGIAITLRVVIASAANTIFIPIVLVGIRF